MGYPATIKDNEGNEVYPITGTNAVYNSEGKTVETLLTEATGSSLKSYNSEEEVETYTKDKILDSRTDSVLLPETIASQVKMDETGEKSLLDKIKELQDENDKLNTDLTNSIATKADSSTVSQLSTNLSEINANLSTKKVTNLSRVSFNYNGTINRWELMYHLPNNCIGLLHWNSKGISYSYYDGSQWSDFWTK